MQGLPMYLNAFFVQTFLLPTNRTVWLPSQIYGKLLLKHLLYKNAKRYMLPTASNRTSVACHRMLCQQVQNAFSLL
jgi:hypothetical protein